ncbi:MAG TPA: HAD hydrolase family protein [Thermoanaerobaculia bacterium]|nr:HAD hydrolase family protein [Thermoanaerobaculia bacterium]
MESVLPNRSWTPELDRKACALAWIVLDVDGVLTDGRLHLGNDGELVKSFHVRDGLAVKLAQAAGLQVAILSARSSEIVARRAAEIGIAEIVQGCEDKAAALRELLARRGVASAAAAYVGDDLQDLAALRAAGLSAAPADAVAEVRDAVDYVTDARGGDGCVRELIERVLVARGAWSAAVERFAGAGAPDGERG